MDIRPVGGVGTLVRPKEAGSIFVRYFVYPLWTGVSIKALALFYRQLATILGSGMSISEALRSLGSRTRGRLGAIIREVLDTIQQGGTLSQTLERHPRVFSRLQLSLVRVGESSGLMEAMADRIASYLEYEISVRQMIAKSMIYPIVVLAMAFSIQVGLPNVKVAVDQGMPAFLKVVLPTVWRQLGPLLAIVVILKLIFQFETPRLIWDAIKIQPPIIGGTARKIAMSRFCRALAVLYSAGVTLSEAVSISADACANLFIGRAIKPSVAAIQAGRGLTESLTLTGAVSPTVLDMLATGERTGNM
ncbi:MAG: type II secretion system F family protein, partial [Armatimonadota bacterium]